MNIVVLGAGGQFGREVVRALLAHRHTVRAVVRHPPSPPLDSSVDIFLVADAHNKEEVRIAFTGRDAIVNAIGAGTLRRNDVESSTTSLAVAAAQKAGVKRYIAMSAGMVALDWPLFKYVLRPLIFRNILAEHLRVEEIVKATPLDWTIVRPPRLTNSAPQGFVATLEPQPTMFSAARADVADFIADEIDRHQYIRKAVFVASRRNT